MTFKTACLFSISALILVACGETITTDLDTSTTAPDEPAMITAAPAPQSGAARLMEEGAVVLTVDRTISEDAACLVMMSVVNGLDEPANAGLFAFRVTGNGESAGGNMFPQTADPGDTATAQVVLPGSSCENVKVIEGGQANCTLPDSDGASCMNDLILRDNVVAFDVDLGAGGE